MVSIPCLLMAVDPATNGVTQVQYSRAAKGKAPLGAKRAARGMADLPDTEDYGGAAEENGAAPAARKGLLKNGKAAKKKESTDSRAWDDVLKSKETEKDGESESEDEEAAEEKEAPAGPTSEGASPKKGLLNPPAINSKLKGRMRGVMPRGANLFNAVPLAGGESLAPQISVAWKHQGNFVLGKQATCQLVVKNQGKQPVQKVALDVSLAAGAKLLSTQPQAEESPSCLTWQIESLGADEERTFEVTFVPQERGEFPATAALRVTSAGQAQFYVEEPLLKLAVHAPKGTVFGEPTVHEITVTNPGTGVAHNVVVESDLPNGLTCNNSSKVSLIVGDVKPGEAKTVHLELKSAEKGPQKFTLAAKGEGELRDSSNVEFEVLAPNLKLEANGPSLRYVNRRARYQFSITNTGNSPAQDVQIVGMIPAGFQVVGSGTGGKKWTRRRRRFRGHCKLAEGECDDVAGCGRQRSRDAIVSPQGDRGAWGGSGDDVRDPLGRISSVVLEIRDQGNDPVETKVDGAMNCGFATTGRRRPRSEDHLRAARPEMQFVSGNGPTGSHLPGRENYSRSDFVAGAAEEVVYKLNVRSVKTGNAKLRAKLLTPSLQKPVTVEELTRIYAD
ncbi:MAG: hypothetical protein U0903_22675 [Planctomycetales bacterium]